MTDSLGGRLMLWASRNLSTLHLENDDCADPYHCGGVCVPSGYVSVREPVRDRIREAVKLELESRCYQNWDVDDASWQETLDEVTERVMEALG